MWSESDLNLFTSSTVTLLPSRPMVSLSFGGGAGGAQQNHRDPSRNFLGAQTPAWHCMVQERVISWSPVFRANGALRGDLEWPGSGREWGPKGEGWRDKCRAGNHSDLGLHSSFTLMLTVQSRACWTLRSITSLIQNWDNTDNTSRAWRFNTIIYLKRSVECLAHCSFSMDFSSMKKG